jgi:hypothetical protein
LGTLLSRTKGSTMSFNDKCIFACIAGLLISFAAVVFVHNVPAWCAHPEGDGNWIVVALGFCN